MSLAVVERTLTVVFDELRTASRRIRRGGSASVMTIASLALGISGVTGSVCLREALRRTGESGANGRPMTFYSVGSEYQGGRLWAIPTAALTAIAARGLPVSALAAHREDDATLRWEGGRAHQRVARISPTFFSAVGARVVRGSITGLAYGYDRVAIVSEAFWRGPLGGDSAVVGKVMDVDGVPHAVVAVIAATFPRNVGVWVVVPMDSFIAAAPERPVGVVASLAKGATAGAISADLTTLRVSRSAPDERLQRFVRIGVAPLADQIVWSERNQLAFVTAVGAIIALVTGVNLAGLMVAQRMRNRHEWAVRLALGATRARMVWYELSEGLVLAATGGVASVPVSFALIWLLGSLGSGLVSHDLDLYASLPVFGAAIGACVGVVTLFGVRPRLRLMQTHLGARELDTEALSPSVSRPHGAHWDQHLIGVQVALAVAASVFTLNVYSVARADSVHTAGFEFQGLWTGQVAQDTGVDAVTTGRALRDKARASEGVFAASLMITGVVDRTVVRTAPRASPGTSDTMTMPAGGRSPWLYVSVVDEAFTAVLRPQLVSGRLPTAEELAARRPVAVITERADSWLRAGAAHARFVHIESPTVSADVDVIGIVRDLREHGADELPVPQLFSATPTIFPRFPSEVRLWVRPRIGPGVPQRARGGQDAPEWAAATVDYRPAREMIAEGGRNQAAITDVGFGVAMLALLLSGLGTYSAVAREAVSRRRSLAVRRALGASNWQILGTLVRGVCLAGAVGIVAGAGLGVLLWRSAGSSDAPALVEQISRTLPVVASAILTLGIALVGPARTALSAPLVQSLRAER